MVIVNVSILPEGSNHVPSIKNNVIIPLFALKYAGCSVGGGVAGSDGVGYGGDGYNAGFLTGNVNPA